MNEKGAIINNIYFSREEKITECRYKISKLRAELRQEIIKGNYNLVLLLLTDLESELRIFEELY